MEMEFIHVPVMLNECIEGLDIKPDGIYLDGTLGGGGHSLEIVKRLTSGRLIAIDRDNEALLFAKDRLKEYKDKITYIHDDFKNIFSHFDDLKIDKIDGFLLDLGVSSYQIDNEKRGFSYKSKDSLLDMRMDSTQHLTAFKVVNEYTESALLKILYEYGEERFTKNIVSNILDVRNKKTIRTTGELSEIITRSIPLKYRYKDGNPCKRTFQAIRIEVNSELNKLYETIIRLVRQLKKNGRGAIISFHSLEDRIVKRAFKYLESSCICDKNIPVCVCDKICEVEILTKKPQIATESDLKVNSRAESAKLRIVKKIV